MTRENGYYKGSSPPVNLSKFYLVPRRVTGRHPVHRDSTVVSNKIQGIKAVFSARLTVSLVSQMLPSYKESNASRTIANILHGMSTRNIDVHVSGMRAEYQCPVDSEDLFDCFSRCREKYYSLRTLIDTRANGGWNESLRRWSVFEIRS